MQRTRFALARVLIAALFVCAAARAYAEGRVALVIGNANYLHANPLTNPVHDANLIASVLKGQGFEVSLAIDADQRAMKRAFSEFAGRLQAAGRDAIAVVYYAGHGVQLKGVNYLVPVDAQIDSEAQLDLEAVSADTIMQAIGQAGSSLNIVILDACRNNPFRGFRAMGRGLAAIDAPQGTLVAFSTAPGQAARDGEAGGNSPYSQALGEVLRQPGLRIEDVFKRVRQRVNKETGGEQTPWESSSLVGDFYPAGGGQSTEAVKPPIATITPAAPSEPRRDPPLQPYNAQPNNSASVYPQRQTPIAPPPTQARYFYIWDVRPPDDWLALRTDPTSRFGQQIARLPNGTLLEVIEQRPDNWWRVRAVRWGAEGWVLSRQGSRVWIYCCRTQ